MSTAPQVRPVWNEESAKAADDREVEEEAKETRQAWNDWGEVLREGTQRRPTKHTGETSNFLEPLAVK